MPLPNLPGLENATANNFFVSQPFDADRSSLDNKINWHVSDRFNTFLSWNYATIGRPTSRHSARGSWTARASAGVTPVRHGATTTDSASGTNYIVGPTLLMDAFWGWTRQNTNVEQLGIGENLGLGLLGLPGTNGPERFQTGWPQFDVSGYSAFGTEEP